MGQERECLQLLGCKGVILSSLQTLSKSLTSHSHYSGLLSIFTVGILLYCTVLYCNCCYCTVLYCTVLYCTVLYCTVLYCTVLYCTVLYCTVLYCTVLYCNDTSLYMYYITSRRVSPLPKSFISRLRECIPYEEHGPPG